MTHANDNGLGVPPGSRVYLLSSPRQNAVKLGVTNDVYRRFRDLNQGPFELVLLAHVPGDRRTEMAFLASFPGMELRGEWFVDDGLFTKFVAKNMTSLARTADAEGRLVTQIEAMALCEYSIHRHSLWLGGRRAA